MPAVPAFLIEPIWDQFQVLNPEVVDAHPLGCDRPRVDNRIVFDKVIQILVLGCAYEKIADSTCSAATIRRRRDEWITAGGGLRPSGTDRSGRLQQQRPRQRHHHRQTTHPRRLDPLPLERTTRSQTLT